MKAAFILFRCGTTRCALAHAAVAQIAPMPLLSRPPTKPAIVEGIANVAGRAVPVIDAARLFGVPADDGDLFHRHLIVLKGDVALMVDRVEDVGGFDMAITLSSNAKQTLNGCVAGVAGDGDSAVYVLAADRILMQAEARQVEDLARAEQLRLDQWAAR